MRVIKKINNNVALCLDENQTELIAFGRGIGFPQMPYVLDDLNLIDRTFYGVDPSYVGLLNEIPTEVFSLTLKIIQLANQKCRTSFNPNLLFTLADHIHFAMERSQTMTSFTTPLLYDIENLYEDEYAVAKEAVKMIRQHFKIVLPRQEAASIALHLINAKKESERIDVRETDIEDAEIVALIEAGMGVKINTDSFNYSRFLLHLRYLLKRSKSGSAINSQNRDLYEKVKGDYPDAYKTVMRIVDKICIQHNLPPWEEEEILYLMLHINRLCSREDCNR